MYASTKIIPTLHSQSTCEKLQVEERVLEALIKYIGLSQTHLCCTALLKVTEDRRASLDIREAVDLPKTFDSVCHPLLLAKLKAYGFTDKALELMTVYL